MDINDVYLARIYFKYDEYAKYSGTDSKPKTHSKSNFVKLSFVIKKSSKNGKFKYYEDLFTKEKYMHFTASDCRIGELYVKQSKGLIPVTSLIDANISETNMPKKRIRKLVNDNYQRDE